MKILLILIIKSKKKSYTNIFQVYLDKYILLRSWYIMDPPRLKMITIIIWIMIGVLRVDSGQLQCCSRMDNYLFASDNYHLVSVIRDQNVIYHFKLQFYPRKKISPRKMKGQIVIVHPVDNTVAVHPVDTYHCP